MHNSHTSKDIGFLQSARSKHSQVDRSAMEGGNSRTVKWAKNRCHSLVLCCSAKTEIIMSVRRPCIRAHFLIRNVGQSGATPIVGVAPLWARIRIGKWDHRAGHGFQWVGRASASGGPSAPTGTIVECGLHINMGYAVVVPHVRILKGIMVIGCVLFNDPSSGGKTSTRKDPARRLLARQMARGNRGLPHWLLKPAFPRTKPRRHRLGEYLRKQWKSCQHNNRIKGAASPRKARSDDPLPNLLCRSNARS